jgi:hypothetical protein
MSSRRPAQIPAQLPNSPNLRFRPHSPAKMRGRLQRVLCLRAIAAALLTSALLLQVRWDTLKFVVQILAQSRLSKA